MERRPVAFDVETTGLELHRGHRIFAYATCNEKGDSEVVRDGFPSKLDKLWRSGVPLIMHNARFDMLASEVVLGRGLSEAKIHCTHKMSHVLQNHHHTHTLDHLAWELAGYNKVDSEVKRIAASCGGYHKVPRHIMSKYQKLDVERTMCLFLFFWPKIQANKKWLDCYQVEIDLIPVSIKMEKRGLHIHRKRTLRMIDDLQRQADEAHSEVNRLLGRRVNPGSDTQLRQVLYHDLGLPVTSLTEKSKEPSLDKHVLLDLRGKHPVIDPILKYRSYTKGMTTLQSYLDLSVDGVLHPTINTCQAVTARQSSSNPNLQNVQKSGVLLNPFPVLARHAFKPRPGYVNIHVDYSGIELRLLVHYSKEPELVALIRRDGDPHDLAAQVFYGMKYLTLDGPAKKTLRGSAKNTNFAIPYGASPRKVGISLGLPLNEGMAAYKRYEARWPRLTHLNRTISKWVIESKEGCVESIFGRQIHVPKSTPYVGTNYLIQCTAGEILKRAEIRVDRWHAEVWGDRVGILLPIHDELIIEYPCDLLPGLPDYLRGLRRLMTDFPQLEVPLSIEADLVESSWEHKKPLEVPK